ncbi:hypothetical protein [Nannocystis sp.]|uniref:hypothetical protein n=1 Tax=Nannocystis sp. TaxID=1962667 RepID=UPI0025F261CC|nr:hypothetical protein [Nannocystis sp.]MBK7825533.1 hypothetical protein [Nannocystis sp.]
MTFPRALLHPLAWPLLTVACQQGGDVGSGEGEPGTASTSSSSTGIDPTNTPTTGASSPITTDTSASTSEPDTSSSTGNIDTGQALTSSSGTTGDAPSPICGDGEVGPGEECDLGAAENNDHGACTLECKVATCGDELIWDGEEACDNGADNNDNVYGGCTTQCQLGPRCNDGILQGPEECDLGEDNGDGEFPPYGVPCDDGCRFLARLAFLSSVAYKGGDLGGVEGAHLKCQKLAKQAGFDNSAKSKAWLSDGEHSPFQDFDHSPSTVGLAYVRPDGVRIADDWDDLILNGPGDGIIVTDTGEKLVGKYVWTGTAPSGKAFDPAATCKTWSSSSALDKSRVGLSGVDKQQVQAWMQWDADKQWTSYVSYNCNNANRIYCFEQ